MKKLLPVLIVVAAGATVYVWRTRANPTYVAPKLEEQATTPTTLTSKPGPDECVRVLDVSGMCCGSCPSKVRSALAAVPGVREAVVDFNTKTASVIAPATLDVAKLEAAATFDDYAAKSKPEQRDAMLEVAVAVLALALVAAIVALLRATSERARVAGERDLAHQRLADVERNAGQLKDTFAALAGESLHKNSEQFLRLAEQKLAARESSAVAEMDKRKAAVDALLQPINVALTKTHDELRKLEKERVDAYAGLRTQVQGVALASDELRKETGRLAQAMSSPNVRGRYGELQLQRVAELAGMREYCDFTTQETQTNADGKLLRPDMLVRLPNERVIAIDAKTNISAYLEALKAPTAELAEPHLQRFAQHFVDQVQALSKKGYWREVASPEFVVMFVPGDQFLDAALSRKPDLIDVAAQSNVVIASPSTLIALLRAIHVGWREKRLSDSARELFELGKELHGRVATALGFADKLSRSLGGAVEDYNRFVASVEARLMPTLRKFEDAGVQVGEPIRELAPIERTPRALAAPEVKSAPSEAREKA